MYINKKLWTMRMLEEFIRGDYTSDIWEFLEKVSLEKNFNLIVKWLRGEMRVLKELFKIENLWIIHHDDILSYWNSSVQIDHIFITPHCIYVIETKNWNLEYSTNKNIQSSINQVKKAGKSVYRLVDNNEKFKWKILTKEILVMVWKKPNIRITDVKKNYGEMVEICSERNLVNSIKNYEKYLADKWREKLGMKEDLVEISSILVSNQQNPTKLHNDFKFID
jgi:hypothetical protein